MAAKWSVRAREAGNPSRDSYFPDKPHHAIEDLFGRHLVLLRPMQLINVYVIGLQTFQAVLTCSLQLVGSVSWSARLCGDDSLPAPAFQGSTQHFFGPTAAVPFGSIE